MCLSSVFVPGYGTTASLLIGETPPGARRELRLIQPCMDGHKQAGGALLFAAGKAAPGPLHPGARHQLVPGIGHPVGQLRQQRPAAEVLVDLLAPALEHPEAGPFYPYLQLGIEKLLAVARKVIHPGAFGHERLDPQKEDGLFQAGGGGLAGAEGPVPAELAFEARFEQAQADGEGPFAFVDQPGKTGSLAALPQAQLGARIALPHNLPLEAVLQTQASARR